MPSLYRARPSTGSSISSPPAAMHSKAMSAMPTSARRPDGLLAGLQSASRPAISAEYRHHRRNADAQCPAGARRNKLGSLGRGGPVLGKVEEYFLEALTPGRHFSVRRQGAALRGHPRKRMPGKPGLFLRPENSSLCGRQVSAFDLSGRRRARACSPIVPTGTDCRIRCATGWKSSGGVGPAASRDQLLIETFPRASRFFMVAYPFEGRLAHQTLGMLLTRRLDRDGRPPAGLCRNRLFARHLGA